MKLPRNTDLLQNANNLRKNMTKEEKHLWYDYLCNKPIRFRRQEIIGQYIADFYCEKAKIIVELDGSQHYQETIMEKDIKRTEYFQSLGVEVLRFSNLEVIQNFKGVCMEIDHHVQMRIDETAASGVRS